jgi:predicted  nucleic acid-binding Zn-ribbon protein
MKINEETKISTDIKSIGLIIFAVAISVWAYSEITTRITTLETSEKLMQQDLLEASTQKPIDQEQFMLIEHLSSQVEKLTIRVDDMMHNKVMINSINKDLEKALNDIEKLKDSVRTNIGKLNGDH